MARLLASMLVILIPGPILADEETDSKPPKRLTIEQLLKEAQKDGQVAEGAVKKNGGNSVKQNRIIGDLDRRWRRKIRLSGTIDQITGNGRPLYVYLGKQRLENSAMLVFMADNPDTPKVKEMNRGDKLLVEGNLSAFPGSLRVFPGGVRGESVSLIINSSVQLTDCHLVDEVAEKRKNRLKELTEQLEEEEKAKAKKEEGKPKKRLREEEEEPKKLERHSEANAKVAKEKAKEKAERQRLDLEESEPKRKGEQKRANDRLPQLIKDLNAQREADRIKAALTIGEMGEEAKDALQPLCDAMMDSRPAVRTAVASALEKVDPALHKPLLTFVVDKDPYLRLSALRDIAALEQEGKPAASVILTLSERLARDSGAVVFDGRGGDEVIRTLTAIASDDKRVFGAIADCSLHAKDGTVRLEAIKSLVRTRFKKEAVQALIPILRKAKDSGFRIEAARALGEIGRNNDDKDVVKYLEEALRKDTVPVVKVEAAKALGRIGPDAKDAVKSLEAAKINPNAQVREAANEAIGKIKKD